MKLTLSSKENPFTIDAVLFFAKGPLAKIIDSCAPESAVHVLAHVERDTFSRNMPVRLRLLDMRSV